MTQPQEPGQQDPYGRSFYPQQQYHPQQQGYPQQQNTGFAVASMVLGIIAVVFVWSLFFDVPLAVLAVIFGHLGLNKANNGTGGGKGMAIAGLATGYVALAPTLIFLFMMIVGVTVAPWHTG